MEIYEKLYNDLQKICRLYLCEKCILNYEILKDICCKYSIYLSSFMINIKVLDIEVKINWQVEVADFLPEIKPSPADPGLY